MRGGGSSIKLVIVVSSGIAAACFSASIAAAICGGDSFLARGFAALVRRTLDFGFFDIARVAAFLREGLVLRFPRFELFLLADARFIVLAMLSPLKCPPASNSTDDSSRHHFSAIRYVV